MKFPYLGKRKNSIANKFIFPMILLLLMQAVLFYCTIVLGGTFQELEHNAMDILSERTINRKNYLENEMLGRWSDFGTSVNAINSAVDDYLVTSGADVTDIVVNSDVATEILERVSGEIIYLLRRNSVTGVFIILDGNPQTAEQVAAGPDTVQKSGLYIRDNDPDTTPEDYSDLLIARAPSRLTKDIGVAMDTSWVPQFTFTKADIPENNFFYKPLQAAVAYPEIDADDLCFWNLPYELDDKFYSVITYSLPLRTSDGEVYGVLGVEISEPYLQKQLPYDELTADKKGAYLLAMREAGSGEFSFAASSGPILRRLFGEEMTAEVGQSPYYSDIYHFEDRPRFEGNVYGSVQYFRLYNTNTPFVEQEWALLGIMEENTLFGFSHSVRRLIFWAFGISIAVGFIFIVVISVQFTMPIMTLVREVSESNPQLPVKFSKTNIREIDELATAVEKLSEDVADNASKLSQIVEMTSSSIGAYEYRYNSDQVFYTKRFFSVLGVDGFEDYSYMPATQFKEIMDSIADNIEESNQKERLYAFSRGLRPFWVRVQMYEDELKELGVVQDVTDEIMERRRIEYERDYDVLTALLNRRALHSELTRLFERPEDLGTAALLMMDIDNLKYINDTYGHDAGDQYIRETAQVLSEVSPPDRSILSRMSGDEFYAFFYGFDSKEEIWEIITDIKQRMLESNVLLLGNTRFRIRASAGVAWYPDDSSSYEELIRFADFAMYSVKTHVKGEFAQFSMKDYEENAYLLQKKEELNKLIEIQLVEYHFQPIVDVNTGAVFAYEALMRSKLDSLRTPSEILSLARSQFKLYQIERLTWHQSLLQFQQLDASNPTGCKLFVNSIANQDLTIEDTQYIESHYGPLLGRIVMELTENERHNDTAIANKQACIKRWNAEMALDDYGTGYNSESMLLAIQPNYVKVDIDIVRNIHQDEDRLHILQNIVAYAKAREIKVIAEGVEQPEEMEVLIKNGVDYLQGYYLGRPSPRLEKPPPEVVKQMLDITGQRHAFQDIEK